MASGAVSNAPPAGGANDVSLEEPKKMTREDWRKKKELEEQRKLGNAPAEVDEEGKDINPHIPQYISSVPWYIDPSKRPTLKHQRPQPEKQKQYNSSGDWYKRGVQEHAVATRYRKGACENCGALTHKKKDCMERPRKVGAKYTGMNIAPDEHVQPQLMFDYDGKRDRWNGYNPEEHMKIVEEYSKVDLAKRTLKAQKLQEELASGKLEQVNSPRHPWGEEESNSQTERDHNSEDEDEDKYADDIDMPGQNFDSKRRITVRNLRIREDIAKYGGQEHLDAPPAELLLAQTEDYVEYSRHGTVIKGQEKAIACSKYEEDVKINNHTCIWGSYWKEGKWGYKCCHSFVKYSYCTGEAGKEIANTEASLMEEQPEEEEHMTKPKTLMEIHQEKLKEKKKKKHKKSSNSDSEGEEKKKQEKLKKALNAEEARLLHIKEIMQLDERKRPYNSQYEAREPTEEEMEAYRMKRQRPDDPMASFLGQ
ncbi:pre-mRNA-splicing factor SLU7 isoform X3 [Parus major]|uniref:pre-mRNA-splicing factor SLU7 isoform X3 n=1 Tax=Parus major TaxID=9157 RepID=UPI001443B8A6|nr:pre-mRNA-splicing factor SLU7 isoform X3 [Parus major]